MVSRAYFPRLVFVAGLLCTASLMAAPSNVLDHFTDQPATTGSFTLQEIHGDFIMGRPEPVSLDHSPFLASLDQNALRDLLHDEHPDYLIRPEERVTLDLLCRSFQYYNCQYSAMKKNQGVLPRPLGGLLEGAPYSFYCLKPSVLKWGFFLFLKRNS